MSLVSTSLYISISSIFSWQVKGRAKFSLPEVQVVGFTPSLASLLGQCRPIIICSVILLLHVLQI